MSFVRTSDGTEIYYTDQGAGQPIVFGNDMETYAQDLAEVINSLDLHDVVVVGHSTGGGAVVKYAAQYGQGRVAKVITAGGVPPIMVKSDSNPEGTPIEVFDSIRAGVLKDMSQYWKDLSEPFYGANRQGSRCRRAPETTSGARACW